MKRHRINAENIEVVVIKIIVQKFCVYGFLMGYVSRTTSLEIILPTFYDRSLRYSQRVHPEYWAIKRDFPKGQQYRVL